eukprot:Protomagalhaensia_sp_Gyna_25__4468@NODE_409_length_3527_cov_145_545298_g315_i0_p1_GENE_NODE_409_length_3527_cov_145_545298_g315_i0NODE_409_length_3527_cov_145_545298_g315_i0_p1_ORF_typecomplete_len403_score44_69Lysine_decarbox/PF03641_14/3_9e26LDcluster4/PF18306_1/8_8e03LDcluster4/PF18306_1/3_2e14_NODE_409_length_3527_cov_145_545298_g315_i03041512
MFAESGQYLGEYSRVNFSSGHTFIQFFCAQRVSPSVTKKVWIETGLSPTKEAYTMEPSPDCVPPTLGQAIPHSPIPQDRVLRAFENPDWLRSRDARLVRIMSEFMETQGRLRQHRIFGSIVFFGSARLKSPTQWTDAYNKAEADFKESDDPATKDRAERTLAQLRRIKHLSFEFYDKVTRLAELISEWAQEHEAALACRRIAANVPELPRDFFAPLRSQNSSTSSCSESGEESIGRESSGLAICTGGGPGMMEAANRGAAQVHGARSVGMGITLPFEVDLNPYVEPALALQYHYFFTRKFWMVYTAVGVIAAPGGLGTLDELMEILTLRQTGRIKKTIPIVLFGKSFWEKAVNFDFLQENGLIDDKDREQLLWTDDPQEAFEHIRKNLLQGDAYPGPKQRRS